MINSSPSPGTATVGYRFVYVPKDKEDTALSPFHYVEDTTYINNLKGINIEPTGRGFYYWPDIKAAEAYIHAFTHCAPERAGKLALYRVSGIAKENTYGIDGFVMDEMQYSSEPILEIPVK